jgi:hypothetical protein
MKKTEFPTFLNEQPTVIFGRTGRELLVVICGIFAAVFVYGSTASLIHNSAWNIFCIFLGIGVVILSFFVALASFGSRPLEEWFFIWLFYALRPKTYLYKPVEDFAIPIKPKKTSKKKASASKRSQKPVLRYDIEED